jgi:hypothetical protein
MARRWGPGKLRTRNEALRIRALERIARLANGNEAYQNHLQWELDTRKNRSESSVLGDRVDLSARFGQARSPSGAVLRDFRRTHPMAARRSWKISRSML